jgi:hypothetical protein
MTKQEQYKQTLSELRRQYRIRIIKNTILNLISLTLLSMLLFNALIILSAH